MTYTRKGFNVPVKVLGFALIIMIVVTLLATFTSNTTNKVLEQVLGIADRSEGSARCNAIRSRCSNACTSACLNSPGSDVNVNDLTVEYEGNSINCGTSSCTTTEFECSC